ncbi:catabolite control protein A [Weissella diestrammenae]|uniref:Catabolite control protein A n=1 Tax=Weissella diestrammenae TaxID=1162633 RepID=A0A7G9T7H0_9LACO|nr:catabolite control protein A [Weissella diestrammenae]MCM0582370.1 catabolite control protein A [Weissella diestrammenae]QNN76045.1 catabolite control protein A [Weissella diestrammenae]
MEKQAITIYDVAREAKVSMATVSRVVNGNTNVRGETKKKVEEVIERLGYRPNAVARGLASRKTTTIGVIIPDVTDVYFSELARGIDDVAQMYKYQIILANSDESNAKTELVFESLLGKQVDGILFMGDMLDDNLRAKFAASNVPVVLAGSVDVTGNAASVNIDYISAVAEVTTRLIKAGHQKIAFVSGPIDHSINKDFKLKGYQQALEVAAVPFDESLVITADYDYQSGYQLGKMVQSVHATAAVVVDDEMAAGLLNALTDDGVHVPDDFEIITTNNSHLTVITRPQLSSITQPIYDLGAVAMRMLTKLMNDEKLSMNTMILPHGYVKRETTK